MSRIANIEYKTSYCPYCCGNVIIVDGVAECQHCDYFEGEQEFYEVLRRAEYAKHHIGVFR